MGIAGGRPAGRGRTEEIAFPSTPAEVVTSATSLVNTDGRVEPGVGVELSLRAFGLGDSSLYFTDDATRVLARTSFSIATSEIGDDVALAYGLRTVILDSSDPLMDTAYATCASTRSADKRRETCEAGFHTACEKQHPDDLEARDSCIQSGYLSPDFATCMQEDYNACLDRRDFERSESTEWTSKALALSIARFHRLGNGVWDEAEFGGVGLCQRPR